MATIAVWIIKKIIDILTIEDIIDPLTTTKKQHTPDLHMGGVVLHVLQDLVAHLQLQKNLDSGTPRPGTKRHFVVTFKKVTFLR